MTSTTVEEERGWQQLRDQPSDPLLPVLQALSSGIPDERTARIREIYSYHHSRLLCADFRKKRHKLLSQTCLIKGLNHTQEGVERGHFDRKYASLGENELLIQAMSPLSSTHEITTYSNTRKQRPLDFGIVNGVTEVGNYLQSSLLYLQFLNLLH